MRMEDAMGPAPYLIPDAGDVRLLAAAPELFEALVAVRRHIGLLPTACRLRVDKALRAAGWTFPQGEQEEEAHDPQPA